MAYTRLLRAYYHTEKPIPDGQQYRLARAVDKTQRDAVDVVMAEFFSLVDGEWHQKRADAEIQKYRERQAKARASANARWSPPTKQSERNANALPTQCECNALHTPYTIHKENPPTPHRLNGGPSAAPPDCRFDEFWETWPKSARKQDKKKCLAKWKRSRYDEQADVIIAHVITSKASKQWVDGYEPAPMTYLNGERWNDGTESEASQFEGFI